MSVIIGFLGDEPQVLCLKDGMVHVNNVLQPIRGITQEEIDAFAEELDQAPEGDEQGREAWCHTRRIQFVLRLLERAFGDECTEYLELVLGNLHWRVLQYLGEAEGDLEDYLARRLVPRRDIDHVPDHGHDHHGHDHGNCGCHGHGHGH